MKVRSEQIAALRKRWCSASGNRNGMLKRVDSQAKELLSQGRGSQGNNRRHSRPVSRLKQTVPLRLPEKLRRSRRIGAERNDSVVRQQLELQKAAAEQSSEKLRDSESICASDVQNLIDAVPPKASGSIGTK